ncbi:MAG: DUF362 domain-containing protein, partial [Syntrophorhabdaceae bacterium]|nr:DUF362 domain-containing protein [Syntrophorhabdaceae bacterium]
YRVEEGKETVGWLVYNRKNSTIEEILVKKGFVGRHLEPSIVDALILKESLLSAEILDQDVEKYRWMVSYGFRPTRNINMDGLTLLKMDLSISVLLKKLEGQRPIKPYRKHEVVAVERITDGKSEEAIRQGLTVLIEKLGGIKQFVKKGDTVVIKPNIVADHGMKDGVYTGGIVTDIRLIRSLIELLLPVAGKVIVAEGSSINRSETKKMFALYGYDRLPDIDPSKVSVVDLNTDSLIEKKVPSGKRMLTRQIPVTLERADVIISVPVMKIHFAAIVSLAVKNLQGAVPPLEKYMSHFFGLWQNLINIHHLVKPSLHIIDGIVGQEDFGPVSGIPKVMNLLIGGKNPVAVDAVTMRIMGLDPFDSPPVRLAYLQGLGPVEEDKIEIRGPSIEEVKDPFRLPFINLSNGKDFIIHDGDACPGCRGYLHFVLAKLRRPDPKDTTRQLIDRPLDKRINIYLGPETEGPINEGETNVFMGICQKHNAQHGTYLPGCPPHAEVIIRGIFGLFPDVERPRYADKTEEEKLEEMLNKVLRNL